VFFCSTTDPYQVIHHPDPSRRRELDDHARFVVRRSLELIRDRSTLNVRILTRSPLARRDFDLFRTFVDTERGSSRLLLGMSIPTLRNDLARVHEPHAPAPTNRLATLRAAREAGIPVYVAMAPTYPESDEADLRAALEALAPLDPVTIFHEPINIRAENVPRIRTHAESLGISLNTDVYATRGALQNYALSSLKTVETIAVDLGISDRVHFWPDKSLGTSGLLRRFPDASSQSAWLCRYWKRISEWPTGRQFETATK
jgi:DNA repair photolyase